MKKGGFTIVELLVVISIIALLVSLILPAVAKSRKLAEQAMCPPPTKGSPLSHWSLICQAYREYPCSGDKAMYQQMFNANTLYTVGSATPGFIGEADGFGLYAFNYDGPYVWMMNGGYITSYKAVQCAARVGPSIKIHGFRPTGIQSDGIDLGEPALWFSYNGPHVFGPTELNYGHNGGLAILAGHSNWSSEDWGISYRDETKQGFNNYRSGTMQLSDTAFLCCPGIAPANSLNGTAYSEVEPHLDNARDQADDYGNTAFFQTDGPIWSDPYTWKVCRNYTFGDGHVKFINRGDRAYTGADSF